MDEKDQITAAKMAKLLSGAYPVGTRIENYVGYCKVVNYFPGLDIPHHNPYLMESEDDKYQFHCNAEYIEQRIIGYQNEETKSTQKPITTHTTETERETPNQTEEVSNDDV